MCVCGQDDDGVISYPHAAVPRLDAMAVGGVYPVAFADLVHRLLACAPRKRASVDEAFRVMSTIVPLGIGTTLASSGLTRRSSPMSGSDPVTPLLSSNETTVDLVSSGVGSVN